MSLPTPTPDAARLPGLGAWVAVIGVGLSLLLLFAALLVSLRLEKALTDLVEARAVLVARQLADAVEGGLRFGVPLADQTEIPRKIAALKLNDTGLTHMALLNDQGQPVVLPSTLPATPTGSATARPETRTVQRLLARKAAATADPPRKVWLEGADIHVLMQVRDASGFASGAVWVVYSAREPQTAFAHSLQRLSGWAVAMAVGVTLMLGGMLWALSRRTARALDALGRPEVADQVAAWPLLPAPQALRTLARLEAELATLAPPASPASPPPAVSRRSHE